MKTKILSWFFTLIFITLSIPFYGQTHQYKALFIGNSYTYVNNLPLLISQLATSTGDQLTYNSSTPGGHTFQQHTTNTTTTTLLAEQGWDYVVLQEQSQLPSFSNYQVSWQVYPYAKTLNELVVASNPCAKTVFYMTWGKKNGDQMNCPSMPVLCTYKGVDSLLQLRYSNMADSNNALLCPVAKVWRYLITHHPEIELYDPDQSHPSLQGSYAAACAFYTIFFRKDPALCTFSSSLTASEATIIRDAASKEVYDSLSRWYSQYPPETAANCGDTDFPTTVSETDKEKENAVLLFSTGESLHIESKELMHELSVFSTTGQRMKYLTNLRSYQTTVSLHDLPSGLYYVNGRTSQKDFQGKFYK